MASPAQGGRSSYAADVPATGVHWPALAALTREALGDAFEPWYVIATSNKRKRELVSKNHSKLRPMPAPRHKASGTNQPAVRSESSAIELATKPDDFEVHTAVLDLSITVLSPGRKDSLEIVSLLSSRQKEGDLLALRGHTLLAHPNRLQIRPLSVSEGQYGVKSSPLLEIPPLHETGRRKDELRSYGFDTSTAKTAHWLNALIHLAGSSLSGADRFAVQVRPLVGWKTPPPAALPLPLQNGLREQDHAGIKTLIIRLELVVSTSYSRLQGHLDDRLFESFRLVFHFLYPPQVADDDLPQEAIRLQDFYQALQPAPPISSELAAKLQPKQVQTPLFPFQLRSVAHLLKREGATQIESRLFDSGQDPEGFWEEVDLCGIGGETVWVCRILGKVVRRPEAGPGQSMATPPSGLHLERVNAILADEMGLGKTLDVISLVRAVSDIESFRLTHTRESTDLPQ